MPFHGDVKLAQERSYRRQANAIALAPPPQKVEERPLKPETKSLLQSPFMTDTLGALSKLVNMRIVGGPGSRKLGEMLFAEFPLENLALGDTVLKLTPDFEALPATIPDPSTAHRLPTFRTQRGVLAHEIAGHLKELQEGFKLGTEEWDLRERLNKIWENLPPERRQTNSLEQWAEAMGNAILIHLSPFSPDEGLEQLPRIEKQIPGTVLALNYLQRNYPQFGRYRKPDEEKTFDELLKEFQRD